MENISKEFENAMGIICRRCNAYSNCVDTGTKCTEYETLSKIKEELEVSEKVLEECDKLVQEIKTKEKLAEDSGMCPYCGKENG